MTDEKTKSVTCLKCDGHMFCDVWITLTHINMRCLICGQIIVIEASIEDLNDEPYSFESEECE